MRTIEGCVHRFRLRRKPLRDAESWLARHQAFWTGAVAQLDRLLTSGQLMSGGKVVTASATTDGPFLKAKEIVGGYMLVIAESVERALEVARESPGVMMPGSSVEIREIRDMAGS